MTIEVDRLEELEDVGPAAFDGRVARPVRTDHDVLRHGSTPDVPPNESLLVEDVVAVLLLVPGLALLEGQPVGLPGRRIGAAVLAGSIHGRCLPPSRHSQAGYCRQCDQIPPCASHLLPLFPTLAGGLHVSESLPLPVSGPS